MACRIWDMGLHTDGGQVRAPTRNRGDGSAEWDRGRASAVTMRLKAGTGSRRDAETRRKDTWMASWSVTVG